MKYIVVSDIHGSMYYTRRIEEIIKKENPDNIILLGDLYYHGPRNPLPLEYNPMEVANTLNKYKTRSNIHKCHINLSWMLLTKIEKTKKADKLVSSMMMHLE